ncbi:MAG: molybdopterin-synthase adenylyltransferase MoeB [Chloroflexi bacterium]|nr:molybdopterin-synthase adenylyltransferase MoeB [Chloroflexota bacterium]
MPSIAQIAQQVRPHIKECQPEAVAGEREATAPPRIVDVREQSEWDSGRIPGAELIPLGTLAEAAAERLPRKDEDIVVHCAAGIRSAVAAYQLQQLGYTKVRSMAGGFNLWRERGLPVEAPLRRDQLERYSRHLLIPEVGVTGQQRLLRSKVLLIGAGGLGSPSAYYLAAAGVGTLGIVDSDVVDATNLQRQILHSSERIGEPKVDSAKRTLEALNPDVRVVPYRERLTSANIDQVIGEYDVIVDGADNFPTRYLLNDASIKWRKPVVHGSIYRFEGQVTVFKPFEGPCYRCLFHEPPPPELAPSCAEAGVLGVLPGVIGTIQANEVLKLLLGVGEPLIGRYLLFDALDASFREVKLRRDPECPACGEHPTITGYIDYEGFCAAPAQWRAEHEGAAAPAD